MNDNKEFQNAIVSLKERYCEDLEFRHIVDTFLILYKNMGLNELDFIAAMNYFTHLKNKAKE